MEKLSKVWHWVCFAGFLCIFLPVALSGVLAHLVSVAYDTGKDLGNRFIQWC